jgi:hypothetical protein
MMNASLTIWFTRICHAIFGHQAARNKKTKQTANTKTRIIGTRKQPTNHYYPYIYQYIVCW